MLIPAQQYLTLRSLGAPAVLLSLAMQGVFRGIKDTKTPLFATGKIDLSPVNMYALDILVKYVSIFFNNYNKKSKEKHDIKSNNVK